MFNDRNRKESTPQPSDKEFLKLLLDMLDFKRENNDSISEEELARQLKVILQDEINGEVYINGNILKLRFDTGERFSLKIEKQL